MPDNQAQTLKMAYTHKILMVDDDILVQALISQYLINAGYAVVTAVSGAEMFERLNQIDDIDLVLLDLGLPDEDGIVLARKLRARSAMPIIILTARDRAEDRLAALDVGADDYLTKSVNPEEMLLRIRNLLRRSSGSLQTAKAETDDRGRTFQFDNWIVDMDGFSLTSPKGETVPMTPGEFRVLATLVRQPGRVLSRDQLLDAISGHEEAPSDRMIDAFISRIRKKIEANPRKPEYIQTVTGIGYKFIGRRTPKDTREDAERRSDRQQGNR